MARRSRNLKAVNWLIGLLLLVPVLAFAGVAGTVTHLEGVLSATHADGTTKLLNVASEILEGDILHTQQGSSARIRFIDKGEVMLRPNTDFKVNTYEFDEGGISVGKVALELLKGGLRAVTGLVGRRNKTNFSLDASVATIGIRGTHFGLQLCGDEECFGLRTESSGKPKPGLYADVVEGAISVTNVAGEIVVNAGEFAFVADENTQPQLIPRDEAIQVRLPDTITMNDADGSGIGFNNSLQCDVK